MLRSKSDQDERNRIEIVRPGTQECREETAPVRTLNYSTFCRDSGEFLISHVRAVHTPTLDTLNPCFCNTLRGFLELMDPKNEVEIPVDQVETALIQCAIPGFWGELTIEVCLERTAALEVTLRSHRTTVTHKDSTREEGTIVPSNERVLKVRAKLPELAEKFKVLCPVSQIRATFRDGHIMTFEITEVKPLPPSRSLNVVSR